MTCKHLLSGAPDCVFCHRDQLKQEVAQLRAALDAQMCCKQDRVCEQLKAELHRIRNQSLEWAMTCEHDCPACDAMYEVIKGAAP